MTFLGKFHCEGERYILFLLLSVDICGFSFILKVKELTSIPLAVS